MTSERELFRAYQEWRRLAEAETKAIRSRNWSLLADCQRAIMDFQALVTRLSPEVRDEWRKDEVTRAEKEQTLQTLVNELIVITRRNHSLLTSARDTAQYRLDEISNASRNLNRIKRSYASAGDHTLLETA